ncbi:MAG TPA: hypothetical protein VFM99_09985 [Chitinophagales bacterium]|nr:hypothetical protein [Chitinophagales bacterium]
MKHNHVSHLCILPLISLSVFGHATTDELIKVSFNPSDNPIKLINSTHNALELIENNHTQINGNLMVINSEDNTFLYSKNSSSDNASVITNDSGKVSGEDILNSTNRSLLAAASGNWEIPSRTSLMRLHEFLLMEQLMQD